MIGGAGERRRLAAVAHGTCALPPPPDHPSASGSASIRVTIELAPAAMSRAAWPASVCAPPVKPITRMPAATPAATPATESSITTHSAGETPMLAAACRNRSGAGLPRATSSPEKMCSPKKPASPAQRRVLAMRSRSEEEATQRGPSQDAAKMILVRAFLTDAFEAVTA